MRSKRCSASPLAVVDGDLLETQGGQQALEHGRGVLLRAGLQPAAFGRRADVAGGELVYLTLIAGVVVEEVADAVEEAALLGDRVGVVGVEGRPAQAGAREPERGAGALVVYADGVVADLAEIDIGVDAAGADAEGAAAADRVRKNVASLSRSTTTWKLPAAAS